MKFTQSISRHYASASSFIDPVIDTSKLATIEIHFLLSWFCHHMSQEQRRKMMDEHPVIYKKLMKMDKPENVQMPESGKQAHPDA